MKLSDFDYVLPQELIAQSGLPERDQARLMVLEPGGSVSHRKISDLPLLFKAGDLLVLNDTRVMKTRLIGKKDTGRKVDCLILSNPKSGEVQEVLLRGKQFKPGSKMEFSSPEGKILSAEVLEWLGGARYQISFSDSTLIEACAMLPIPPYIKQPLREAERYQTVYSKKEGSLAAPTAGLHFTGPLLKKLEAQGVEMAMVTLHVGIGTFAPIRAENLEDVKLHSEFFSVSGRAADQINSAVKSNRRIFAVGTTTVRALESCADEKMGTVQPRENSTEIFIRPGHAFKFKLAGLLTNFHLPKSSLLLLAGAFAGREKILSAYQIAIKERYRFFSFGDAMLIYAEPADKNRAKPFPQTV